MALFVDFHSHLFSRTYFEVLARASTLPGSPVERVAAVSRAAGIELPPESLQEHVARWVAELDTYGVGHMVSFASVPEEAEVVAEAVRLAPERLSGMAVLDASAPDAAARAEALVDRLGLIGVVLFPALHGYRVDEERIEPVLSVLEARAALAVVHCGALSIPLRDRFGLPRQLDFTHSNPLFLVPAANAHLGLSFIVPHFGAGMLRETLIVGSACPNVYVDTSSSNAWLATQPAKLTLADAFERTLGVFGPQRVLFGTDSSVFPRGWRHDLLITQREALGAIDASAEVRARVFGGNAVELLGR